MGKALFLQQLSAVLELDEQQHFLSGDNEMEDPLKGQLCE